ncbi:MAG: radical SAM family heme chaperone HemW [Planctomycetota bacterium]
MPSSTSARLSSPRAAYVHVPFCRHHCGYCNFTVIADRLDLVDDYLRAIQWELDRIPSHTELATLYVGGGTPTQLGATGLIQLFTRLRRRFALVDDAEITVEANPEDLSHEHVDLFQELGIHRVSLGIQSFHADKLDRLDRAHRLEDIDRAIHVVEQAGADVAIDLIFAAPDESLADWERDLDSVCARSPQHVSCYGLTYEPGTRFMAQQRQGALQPVHEEIERAQYQLAMDRLTASGFEHYEISNFALPGHRSRHNQVYWQGGTHWGVGPGATRFVAAERATNHRSTTTYLKRVLAGQDPTMETETVSPEAYARERLVFGLRMLEGIDCRHFLRQTGYDVDELAGPAIERYLQMGCLRREGDRLQLTREGVFVSDGIWPDLL